MTTKNLHFRNANFLIKRDKIYHAVKFFGIGRRKLEALFQRFGSIRQMAKADKKGFRGIKQVGRKSIVKINNLLDENIFCQK